MTLYCGNNRLHPTVTSGKAVIGNRYGCFKKGVGKGLHIYNPDYNGPYDPIDTTKSYCGASNDLPDGFDRLGSNAECLNKGIGVGMLQRARKGAPKRIKQYLFLTTFLAGTVGIYLALYFMKPDFVMKKESNGETSKDIDWVQFVGIGMLGVLLLFVILFIVWVLSNRYC